MHLKIKYLTQAILICALLSCQHNGAHDHGNEKVYTAKVKPDVATSQMIQKVKDAYEAVDVEKVQYVFNEKKAKSIQAKLDKMEPSSEMNLLLYEYGDESLRAGNVELSISIFEDFLSFFKGKDVVNDLETISEINRKLAVAYMRKAEIENCVANHNNESCIIPLSTKAQYALTESVNKAIGHMDDFLGYFPRDYEVQYLLNIAHMTLGQYPDSVPIDYRIPVEHFEKNTFPKFSDVAMDVGLDVNALSGGVCIDDFNNDGYLDVMVSSWGQHDQIRYFENDTNGGFEDKTEYTGLVGVTGGLNLKHADYNNDGHLDLIILRGAWLEDFGGIPNSLIKNNGDGTFTDVTEEAGVLSYHPTQIAVWRDYNLDGWLDLFIGNESSPKMENKCELFISNGDGTFKDITSEAGLDAIGYFKGVASGDINNDGYDDIFISNYNGKNLLYINESETNESSFKLFEDTLSIAQPIESFSTWMFDYNNDGFEDIFVSGYSSGQITPVNMFMANLKNQFTQRRPILYKNNGDHTFTNVSDAVGFDEPVSTMGCNFGDLDNDGYLDFYLATGDPSFTSIVPNKMYRNKSGTSFEDVTYSGGFGHIQKGHAVGFGDLDLDGDQDIYAVMGGAYEGDNFQNVLFENPIGNHNNWINIWLEGRESNRSAIGAKIILTINENGQKRKIYNTVNTGASFGGNSLVAEIGVGKATSIEQIEIQWPIREKTISNYNNVEVNQSIKIKEGSSELETLDSPSKPFVKNTHMHH